jgi:glycoprotein endo-alpha-1,2-mannosidase
MKVTGLALVMLAALFSCQAQQAGDDDVQAVLSRASAKVPRPERMVLAFYYPWYGNPETSGRWVHWDKVDREKRDIASATHYPTLGPYDSNDPKTVAQHCAWAREAEIGGFICSWWAQRDFHDRVLPLLLDTAGRHGLKVTVYYEQVPKPGDPESAIDDFEYLLRNYGKHPAWLTVAGKPAIFVYGRAVGQLSLPQWAHVIEKVSKRPQGAIFIGDQLSTMAVRVFDGVHTYNTCGKLSGKPEGQIAGQVDGIFADTLAEARGRGRIGCVTVIPGYDDTKIRKPGIVAERLDGKSYAHQWEAAIKLKPDWVLITSFNEWHEGSEIEPSDEYAHQYLTMTAQYAAQFKSLPREAATETERPSPVPADKLAALRDSLSRFPIAVLPGWESEAAFWLAEAGIPLHALSWDKVSAGIDAKQFPILLYAGGERYVQSVKSENGVDRALQQYLRDGGCLVVIPSEPLPFFYNEKGVVADSAARFGLPIAGTSQGDPPRGFEAPPADLRLTFDVHKEHLPSLASTLEFPRGGDRRWRPFLGRNLPEGDRYVPLIELYDQKRRWWGDGAAYVEHRASEPNGGKALYVWFRLADARQRATAATHVSGADPVGPSPLLSDLFTFLVKQLQ